ncbi:MAG: hypothetical protein GY773_10360 [Actinomycetia bacterium]|nr:hypothetical protein [Actinomycetes bacterium]
MNKVISIRAGSLDGKVFWDHGLQSYVALLQLFDHLGTYPPPVKRFGTRLAEFVTVDAVANHLQGAGLALDSSSLEALQTLRHEVSSRDGSAEIVGITDDQGGRHLLLLTPSRLRLRLQPTVDHPAYAFCWGDDGPTTIETARIICERVLVRSSVEDLDIFALTLTVDYLAGIEGDFSLDVDGLCDWYLADSPLSTGLGPVDLLALARDLDSGRRPQLA